MVQCSFFYCPLRFGSFALHLPNIRDFHPQHTSRPATSCGILFITSSGTTKAMTALTAATTKTTPPILDDCGGPLEPALLPRGSSSSPTSLSLRVCTTKSVF